MLVIRIEINPHKLPYASGDVLNSRCSLNQCKTSEDATVIRRLHHDGTILSFETFELVS